MTVAVSLNLSDGVVLGVDSAVTIPSPGDRPLKIYEYADKLFRLRGLPIGIATSGMFALGARSIASYITEFERKPEFAEISRSDIEDVVESLRAFFMAQYEEAVIRPIQESGADFEAVRAKPESQLRLIVGGFSPNASLSEVWEIVLPQHQEPPARRVRNQGSFGEDWFASSDPIHRYVRGYDKRLEADLLGYCNWLCQERNTSPKVGDVEKSIKQMLAQYSMSPPFYAMPLRLGVEYVRTLIQLTIDHYKFEQAPEYVGGKPQIGIVTHRETEFQVVTP